MTIVTVSARCMCCGTEGSFTTSPESAKDLLWVERMVSIDCCIGDCVSDVEYEDLHELGVDESYIPF